MTIPQIVNFMSVLIGCVCMFVSLRALYVYWVSRSDMLFVLGLAMLSISVATFSGVLNDYHVGGLSFNSDWTRAFGACCGALFIFLSSMVKSHAQMQSLKRAQFVTWGLFLIVIVCTPLYPPIDSPWISLGLNCCRMVIYSCAFVRYTSLYFSKSTRFSLAMSICFLVLLIGYALNIPGYFQSGLLFVTIIAASVRIVAYFLMLSAYFIKN